MKVLDVQPFHEGIKDSLNTLDTVLKQVHSIEQSVKTFTELDDSFKGEGGETIRSFYRSCHLPFLTYFKTFEESFSSVLKEMDNALTSLEPCSPGLIREEFLENTVEKGLTSFGQLAGSLTDETNIKMTAVSDIVSLPPLDDSDVQNGIQTAKRRRDKTINELNEFDRNQKASLKPLAEDIEKMNLWVSDLKGMMEDGLTDIHFPADVWAAYTVVSPLTTDIKKKDESGKAFKDSVTMAKRADTAINGGITSFKMFLAGQNGGLSITKIKDSKTGKYLYRLNASMDALKKLGVDVEPNSQAYKELMKGLPKDPAKWTVRQKEIAAARMATLKFYTKKPGSNGWSAAGKDALKNAAPLEYWNDKASAGEKAKTVGKAAIKGAGKSFKDIVDFKGMREATPLKIAGKALAPVGAILNFSSNYDVAKKDGLDNGTATLRATRDTAIDTAVSGAIQAGATAAGTALIPIPGVGTAAGVLAGLTINYLITKKDKKSGKSIMDHVKGWFN